MKATAPSFDGTQPCAQVDPELFFPEGSSNSIGTALKTVTPICRSCPFKEPCLDYALHNDVQGLWAATTDKQRRELRRKLKIKDVNYMYLTIDKLTR